MREAETARCPTENTLVDFACGALEGESLDACEAHLAGCPACSRAVAAIGAKSREAAGGSGASDAATVAGQAPVRVLRAATSLPRGTRVGRYKILAEIGAGAMGTVYAAHDPELDRKIAIKMLRAEWSQASDARVRERQRREGQAMARLTHPEVIAVYDVGVHDEQLFVAMEFVRGGTLREWLEASPRTWREILDVYLRAGRGLLAAHDAGLVHRDFKPDNVLIGDDGRVRVTDFGLARAEHDVDEDEPASSLPLSSRAKSFEAEITKSGTILGTPAYMAPEQLMGLTADARSDQFSFCVSLYEALYGERPFAESSLPDRLAGRVRPLRVKTRVPPRIRRALLVGLRPEPQDRYPSMRELDAALSIAPRRRSRLFAAGALVLGLAAAGALYMAARPRPVVTADPASHRPTLAVLDLRAASDETGHAWVGAALARTMRAELRVGGNVRALSDDDVARAGTIPDSDTETFRARFGATHVVTGTYAVHGGGVDPEIRVVLHVARAVDGVAVATIEKSSRVSKLMDLALASSQGVRAALGVPKASAEDDHAWRSAFPEGPEAARLFTDGVSRLRAFDARAAKELLESATLASPDAPMPYAALAQALTALGYDDAARKAAQRAFELSGYLSREDRTSVEALYRATSGQWHSAMKLERALYTLYPDNLEYGLRLARAWDGDGHPSDAAATIDKLRALPAPYRDDPRIDLFSAHLYEEARDYDKAKAAADAAAKSGEARGTPLVVAQAMLARGNAERLSGKLDDATARFADASKRFEDLGDKADAATAARWIGVIAMERGDLAEAQRRLDAALATYEELGKQDGAASTLADLGRLAAYGLDLPHARARFDEALARYGALGEKRRSRAAVLRELGSLLLAEGETSRAGEALQQAAELESDIAHLKKGGPTVVALAALALARGDVDGARARLGDPSDEGDLATAANARLVRGSILAAQGKEAEAVSVLGPACAALHDAGSLGLEARCRGRLARAHLAASRGREALEEIANAGSAAGKQGDGVARLSVEVDAAFVRGSVGSAAEREAAMRRLDGVAERARASGAIRVELEARLARGRLRVKGDAAKGREELVKVAEEARTRGLLGIAREAEGG